MYNKSKNFWCNNFTKNQSGAGLLFASIATSSIIALTMSSQISKSSSDKNVLSKIQRESGIKLKINHWLKDVATRIKFHADNDGDIEDDEFKCGSGESMVNTGKNNKNKNLNIYLVLGLKVTCRYSTGHDGSEGVILHGKYTYQASNSRDVFVAARRFVPLSQSKVTFNQWVSMENSTLPFEPDDPDLLCDPQTTPIEKDIEFGDCKHMGENIVYKTSLTSCGLLEFFDFGTDPDNPGNLLEDNVYKWACLVHNSKAHVYTTGFAPGKGLEDLVYFDVSGTPRWKSKYLEVRNQGGGVRWTSKTSIWFDNLVKEMPITTSNVWYAGEFHDSIVLDEPYTVYVTPFAAYPNLHTITNAMTSIVIDADNVSFTTLGDGLTFDPLNWTIISENNNFTWMEGNYLYTERPGPAFFNNTILVGNYINFRNFNITVEDNPNNNNFVNITLKGNRNVFKDGITNGVRGIGASDGKNIKFKNIRMSNCNKGRIAMQPTAISLFSTENVQIKNIDIFSPDVDLVDEIGCGIGVSLSGANVNTVIWGLRIKNSEIGIRVISTPTYITNNVQVGNYYYSSDRDVVDPANPDYAFHGRGYGVGTHIDDYLKTIFVAGMTSQKGNVYLDMYEGLKLQNILMVGSKFNLGYSQQITPDGKVFSDELSGITIIAPLQNEVLIDDNGDPHFSGFISYNRNANSPYFRDIYTTSYDLNNNWADPGIGQPSLTRMDSIGATSHYIKTNVYFNGISWDSTVPLASDPCRNDITRAACPAPTLYTIEIDETGSWDGSNYIFGHSPGGVYHTDQRAAGHSASPKNYVMTKGTPINYDVGVEWYERNSSQMSIQPGGTFWGINNGANPESIDINTTLANPIERATIGFNGRVPEEAMRVRGDDRGFKVTGVTPAAGLPVSVDRIRPPGTSEICPTLNGLSPYRGYYRSPTDPTAGKAMMYFAVEVLDDGIGDDDLVCSGGETCIFMRNIGAYQGSGIFSNTGVCDTSSSGNWGLDNVDLKVYQTRGL